jgi:acyl-CoA synthetase (AMP-forming)/AMP-acid ligase II
MPAESPTVAAVIKRQSRIRDAHPLLVCDQQRLSYAEADRRSVQVARGLVAMGVGKGTHVGLLHPNGPDFVVGMLATTRIGAVAIPFTTFATARELGEQLAGSDVAILLATPSYRSHDYASRCSEVLGTDDFGVERRLFCPVAPQLRHVVFDLDDVARLAETIDSALLTAMEEDVDGSDSLAIVYTSGSTGAPKGAVHTHASLLAHQRNLNDIRGLSSNDVLFCNSPFFWVGGLAFGLLATLVAGATLVCSNAIDPADTLDLLEAERPTVTNGFAATVAHLARHEDFAGRDLSSMRRGNLYPIMPSDARPADPELRHNMLGMTEAGGTLLLSEDESDQPEYRRGSFGRPAPGFEVAVVDPETELPVQAGAAGELRIRGPHLMQRYHRRSREESFEADGWFTTGDLVCMDVDGFVYFLGRRGAMIKTAGANVSPAEVERVIAAVTGGTVAHVIGLPDRERGEVVAAAIVVDEVVADDPSSFDESRLRTALSSQLSAYKIPRHIKVLAATEVPRLSSGKVDTRRLRSMFDV